MIWTILEVLGFSRLRILKGFLTILIYILVGLLGFGVFSNYKSGIVAILGPTGGYIIGFLFMALVVGYMIEKGHGRTKKGVLICMIIGELILYAFGLTGLWLFLGNASLWNVLTMGFFPFLIGDTIKIVAAISLFPWLFNKSKEFYLSSN